MPYPDTTQRNDATLVAKPQIYEPIKVPWYYQTRDKQYSTDLLGFMSGITDKITGNDTETVDVRGEIKQDNRSDFGRYMDNQLQHNNTPLGYTYRTLMPAGGIATSILFPATTLRIGLGGLAGSTAANIGSTLATGKS